MSAFTTAPAEAEKKELSPLLGRALRARKALRLFRDDLLSEGLPIPVGYGRVLRNVNDVIASERSSTPGRVYLLYSDEAGKLLGLTKERRRRLNITPFRAIDETPEERTAYVKERARERDRERKQRERAAAKAAQPRKPTAAERAKAKGMSLRTYYRWLKKLAGNCGVEGDGTLSVRSHLKNRAAPQKRAAPPATAAVPQARPAQEPIEDIAARRVTWAQRNPLPAFDRMRPEAEYPRAVRFLRGAPSRAVLARQLGAMYAASEALHVTVALCKERDIAETIVRVVEARP